MHGEAADAAVRITGFIRDRFLDGDPAGELSVTTPLLEWGLLNSLNTATLLGFIRAELGVVIPPMAINPRNFKDIDSISALVAELAGAGRRAP
jgi:acyl carrier protein